VIVRVLWLCVAAASFWIVLGLPARNFGGGDQALLDCGVALLLALVPGLATIIWASLVAGDDPNKQTVVILGSTGIRMFFVLACTLLLNQTVPMFRHSSFLLWVAGAYLFLLAVEVILLVRARQSVQNPNSGVQS
jgi:threonine/homoserine/homoserine lactone efflux protein